MIKPKVRKKRSIVVVALLFLAANAAAFAPQTPSAPPADPRAAGPAPYTPHSAQDFERLLAKLDAREHFLEREVKDLGPAIRIVRQRMTARGRRYYRLVRAGFLPIGGGFEEMVDHATRVERLRSALKRDIALSQQLRSRQKTARSELRRVRAERAPLLLHREAMLRAQSVMQEADDRQAAYHRTFGAAGPSLDGHTAIYGASRADGSDRATAQFTSTKGRLSFPLSGRAEVLDKRGDPGLWFKARPGAVVRSVHPGRVLFAGPARHGLTVVVDQGDGFSALYANLRSLQVQQGDYAPERHSLGRLHEGLRHSATLYFELRKGEHVLDTAVWMGL